MTLTDAQRTPPKAAQDNARRAIRWREEHGDEVQGGTRVGWLRAQQLADGEPLSEDVIGQMAAFERHRENSQIDPEHEGTPWRDAGYVAWLRWGGDEGVEWAQRVSEMIDREEAGADWHGRLALQIDPNHGAERTSWVFALPEGLEIARGERTVDVSGEMVAAVAANTRRAYAHFDARAADTGATPYRWPILEMHERSSRRRGTILQVKRAEKLGRSGLWVQVEWGEDAWAEIQRGEVQHVSVGLVREYQLDTGEMLGWTLVELSLVDDPAAKSIGTIQDTLDVTLAQQREDEMEEKIEEMMERLAALEARYEEMMEGEEEMMEDGDGEMMEDYEEMSARLDAAIEQLSQVADKVDKIRVVEVKAREAGREGSAEPEQLSDDPDERYEQLRKMYPDDPKKRFQLYAQR